MWSDTLYYLPGHGGRLHTGLGEALVERGWAVTGRETVGDFRAAGFQVQVDTVAQDLREHFWHPGAHVICNSFGAYLFLHAQAQMPAYPGRVLLLSPIVGAFEDVERMQHFVPPRAEYLARLAEQGRYTPPARCEIHVSELECQSVPARPRCWPSPHRPASRSRWCRGPGTC